MSTRPLPSDTFNKAWEDRKVTKPVIILIGGYAGTGKSTLASRLAKRLSYAQTIPTGIFRSIAQTQYDQQQNQALFVPTYELHTVYGQDTASIVRAYKEQCAPVTNIIESVFRFLALEKQHLIIEGNHILPWETYRNSECHIIELYTYVKNEGQHLAMLGGPTHNRTITAEQFVTGRTIHDILHSEALSNNKKLFECSEMDKAESYLQKTLKKFI